MALLTTPAYHTSNSYGTLSDAESYFTTYGRVDSSDSWNSLTNAQKEYALIIAARVMNTFSFRGMSVTRQQVLAFPRFTNYQMFTDEMSQVASFYDIDYTKLYDEVEFTVTNNKFVSTNSSADKFYANIDDGDLLINQFLKVVRGGTEYLTIKDMDVDGEWIQVKEDIEQESDLATTIYTSDIFGYPDEIAQAQYELAFQVVNTKIFQATIGEDSEYPVAGFTISGGMSVRYQTELFKGNNFENSKAIDIVYALLGDWLAGVGGKVI